MTLKSLAFSVSVAALCSFAATAQAETIGGIEFPDGAASFADEVVSFVLGDGVSGTYDDPNDVLGVPDWNSGAETGSFSLGRPGQTPDNLDDALFGSVTVRFTDNSLTTSGDASPDLFIFEIGGAVERFQVEISTDNSTWIDVGTLSGQPTSIDIDAVTGVVQGARYSFVRVTDAPGGPISNGPRFAGPDIDAIGAISSAAPVVPLPAAGWLLIAGIGALVGLRRRA